MTIDQHALAKEIRRRAANGGNGHIQGYRDLALLIETETNPGEMAKWLTETYEIGHESHDGDEPEASASSLIDFTEIKARPVKWAWRDRIALGKMTALSGRPKIGKGLLYSDLIAKVTKGTLDGDLDGPGHVIVVTTEDDPGDTLKPRLLAAGADLTHVSYFQMGTKDDPVPFRVPEHAEELERRVSERKTALVVMDPLVEFIDGRLDTHKSAPVRQAFASLNPVAREYACAILTIIHLNKGASTDTHLRHEASAAFTQVVRGGLLLGRDPDDPDGDAGDQRVLVVSSSNLSRIPPALVYQINTAVVTGDEGEEIETANLAYVGESAAESHDLLRGHDPEERTERDEAKDFLRAELAAGPRKQKEVEKASRGSHADRTLRRARTELGVRFKKEPIVDGPWWWALPDQRWPWEREGGHVEGGQGNSLSGGQLRKDGFNKRDSDSSKAEGGHGFGGGQVQSDESRQMLSVDELLGDEDEGR